MNAVKDAGSTGNTTDLSTTTPEPPIAALERELLTGLRVLGELATRILDCRGAEEGEPTTERRPLDVDAEDDDEEGLPASPPPFAQRCDGRLMLCVDGLGEDYYFGLREVHRFIVLSRNEKEFVLERLDTASQDTAAHFVATFNKPQPAETERSDEQ